MSFPVRIILYAVAGVVVLCAILFLMQRRLLYHPDTTTPSGPFLDQAGLTAWPGPGLEFRGYLVRAAVKPAEGFVMVFHGNAGAAADRGYYGRMLGELGYRVVLAEYPGYGGRSGDPSERLLVEDARAVIHAAYRVYGRPVILVGESLGCGVAAAAAADPAVPVDGIVLITPWDSLPGLAQSVYPLMPVRWLALDRYDSVRNLADFNGRIAVAVSEWDEVIPMKHGIRLFSSLKSEKRLWIWREAGHNSWPDSIGVDWWREAMDFIRKPVHE
jgi:pimeloyl-ACP methyl ester carboxylesterase